MYFLERKEPWTMPNILGGHSMPVHSYRWKPIAMCLERWPLEKAMESMNRKNHRITTNQPKEEGE